MEFKYYALSDSYTGDYPKEYSAGLPNTKVAIYFDSREDRDQWLEETKFTLARPLTRKQAVKYASWIGGVKVAFKVSRDGNLDFENYSILRKSEANKYGGRKKR